MNDPRNAKYIVYDPHVDETYLCPTEEDALAIAQNALENIWPEKDEGIYIATLTVTPTHKAVIADEWEEDGKNYCDFSIKEVQGVKMNLKNFGLSDMQKEELLAKLNELQAFLVKGTDEASNKIDPHNPSKDYYEGAYRAYEIAVYVMYDIFGIEPPEHWGKTNSSRLEDGNIQERKL